MTLKGSENVKPNSGSILIIEKEKLHQNLAFFKSLLKPKTLVMAMVKADAYGHGDVEIAQELEINNAVDYFGVSSIQKGIELRKVGIELQIMVSNPISCSFELMCEHCLEPVIHNLELAEHFSKFIKNSNLVDSNYPIHVKLNTGMNRFGMNETELDQFLEINKKSSWKVKSIMSHLSCSDQPDEDEFTRKQFEKFESIKSRIETLLPKDVIWHLLNSNGIIRFPEKQYNMVRIGIGLYGGSEYIPARELLKPIASFQAQIAQIQHVKKGDSISYSRSGRATEDKYIGIIAVGYADGFPRSLGNGKWEVEWNGNLYPTIGNVCMDFTLIDLGFEIPKIKLEESVILFGGLKSIYEFAEAQSTICYEAMTNLGNRVQRILIN